MRNDRFIYTSLTRISNLETCNWSVHPLPKADWQGGDYILIKVNYAANGQLQIELPSGRMTEVIRDDLLIGALGVRHATLEATGSWQEVEQDGTIHVLTGAGLLGKLTSKSVFLPSLISGYYQGHLLIGDQPANMKDFVPDIAPHPFTKPVVLIVGTSMSAGKTTAARIVTRQLKRAGLKVVGGKLTGAGRYKDILAVRDAGADDIFDFVDVGLPSTVCPPSEYLPALRNLLSLLGQTDADVAVIEIGASPLEPYNGDIAIREIRKNILCTVLCASDPYAVLGVMKSFNMTPDIVSGSATNTLGGRELVEKLCNVRAINLLDPVNFPELRLILGDKLRDILLHPEKWE